MEDEDEDPERDRLRVTGVCWTTEVDAALRGSLLGVRDRLGVLDLDRAVGKHP